MWQQIRWWGREELPTKWMLLASVEKSWLLEINTITFQSWLLTFLPPYLYFMCTEDNIVKHPQDLESSLSAHFTILCSCPRLGMGGSGLSVLSQRPSLSSCTAVGLFSLSTILPTFKHVTFHQPNCVGGSLGFLVVQLHLSVPVSQKKEKQQKQGHSRLCDFKWPQIDIWPHNIGRASQADQHVWVLWPCYVTWTSYSIFWWKWTFDPSDPKWPQNDIWPHNIGRGSQADEHV